jgi:plasmid stability protein
VDPLVRVKRAATSKRRAEQEYRAALAAAVSEHGYAATAKAAGVSRQSVRQQLTRAQHP